MLLLRDIEQVDPREAAQRLGITDSNVKTRLHRARHMLRRFLDNDFGSLARVA